MKKLLLIALLVVGCDNSTESNKHGCLDGQATNYDATASIDNNTCTYIDSCGVIDIDLTNDCVQDECDVWGGDGIVEGACDCDGNSLDCLNVCGGDDVLDDCGICTGIDEYVTGSCYDCADTPNGTAYIDTHSGTDACPSNYCVGGTTELTACVQDCAGTYVGTMLDANNDGFCDDWVGLTVTDIDGNTYNTVQIGYQLWMKENLKVTKYKNGDAISTGLTDSEWQHNEIAAYAAPENNTSNSTIYGNLYNGWAVQNSNGLCMDGWHVPTDSEFTVLTDYLGGSSVAGNRMKEEGTSHWNSPNEGATNESGFTALPSGLRRGHNGSYLELGSDAYFYTSSISNWYRNISYWDGDVNRHDGHHYNGMSVRCLKD